MSQTIPSRLQTADRFLECFLEILSDTHDFTHSTHLRTQFVLYPFEFLEGPSGKFDYHIVSIRHVFVQRTVFSAGDLIQRHAGCQHGGHQCDGEPGRLGRQSGGTGCSGIDLDDDIPVRFRIMRPLYIGSADHLDGFYDFIRFFLQPFLHVFRNGQHRSRTERISCVNAKRINVFNEAHGDHVVFGVTNHFQFQFLPAKDGFLHKNLPHQTGLKTSCADSFQFFHIVNQAAAGAAHGICRTKDNRISQFIRDL